MSSFDVVVVGARCAGAPLAAELAGAGARVALVEQARFPSDTLSSHIFEADALAFLHRLGLAERLRSTGAPFVNRADIRIEDLRIAMPWPRAPGDAGGMMSVRRQVLDGLLAERASEAGAELRTGTKAVALCEEHGRVSGVRVRSGDREEELGARLVVGADGRRSTIGRLCGARSYNVVENQRALYWGYFEGVHSGSEPTFLTHRWGDHFLLGIPTDGGLYQVLAWPEFSDLERHRRDHEAAFAEQLSSCEPLREMIAPARRVGRLQGAVRWNGFFRESAGPGWVLVGDAGHFKDPAPGRGIGDAFLQVGALAPAISAALGGPDGELDRAMARWARWRDREFAEHYWLANDMGEAGAVPPVLGEMIRLLDERGEAGRFLELLNHRLKPSQLLTPPRLLAATARLVRKGRGRRGRVLREVAALGARDAHRRLLNHRPRYEAAGDGAAASASDRAPAPERSPSAG